MNFLTEIAKGSKQRILENELLTLTTFFKYRRNIKSISQAASLNQLKGRQYMPMLLFWHMCFHAIYIFFHSA